MKISFTDKDSHNYNYISCFYNLKNDYVFVSKKVCYSSFCSIDTNKCIRTWEVNDTLNLNGLVRNPYIRLESLYKDKLIKNLDSLKLKYCPCCGNKPDIQHCQSHIIDLFGEKKFFNKQISFKEFVLSLSHLVTKECHFFPQSKFIPKFVDKIFYLESETDIECLFRLFDTEKLVKNTTFKQNLEWDKEMYDVVNNVYCEDFKRFNYKFN